MDVVVGEQSSFSRRTPMAARARLTLVSAFFLYFDADCDSGYDKNSICEGPNAVRVGLRPPLAALQRTQRSLNGKGKHIGKRRG